MTNRTCSLFFIFLTRWNRHVKFGWFLALTSAALRTELTHNINPIPSEEAIVLWLDGDLDLQLFRQCF